MDRIDTMRAFARVVERRSFAMAAHDLALPRSRVSEAVQQLEQQLGVRLLTRTTRQVAPTAEGEVYYQHCVPILAAIDSASAAVSETVPAGPLRIDVHGTFSQSFILPAIPDFLKCYSGIQLHIGESDRLVDLVAEGVDCVIRVGEPADSSLIGRRLGLLEEGTFASPAYLARHRQPSSPNDLSGHQMIGFISSRTKSIIPLEFQTDDGLKTLRLPTSVTVSAAATTVCLAVHGLGLIQVPRYRVAHELNTAALVEVLPEFPPSPSPVYILHPEGRHLSSRARVFIDWVSTMLTAKLIAR